MLLGRGPEQVAKKAIFCFATSTSVTQINPKTGMLSGRAASFSNSSLAVCITPRMEKVSATEGCTRAHAKSFSFDCAPIGSADVGGASPSSSRHI